MIIRIKQLILVFLALLSCPSFSQHHDTVRFNGGCEDVRIKSTYGATASHTLKIQTTHSLDKMKKCMVKMWGPARTIVDSTESDLELLVWNGIRVLGVDSVNVYMELHHPYNTTYVELGFYHPLKCVLMEDDTFIRFAKDSIFETLKSDSLLNNNFDSKAIDEIPELNAIHNYLSDNIYSNDTIYVGVGYVRLDITETGQIFSTDVDVTGGVFISRFYHLLKNINFPILWYENIKKPISYHLTWEFGGGNSRYSFKNVKKWNGKLDTVFSKSMVVEGSLFNEKGRCFALATSELDTSIYFYEKKDNEYVQICKLSRHLPFYYGDFMIRDFNKDGKFEVWLLTANSYLNEKEASVYIFDNLSNSVKWAGFSSPIDSFHIEKKEYIYYTRNDIDDIAKIKCYWQENRFVPVAKIQLLDKELDGHRYFLLFDYKASSWELRKQFCDDKLKLEDYKFDETEIK